MKERKTWFIGYSSRLLVPAAIEGWLATASFFTGIFFIQAMNNTTADDAPLTFLQICRITIESACLLGGLRFISRGHVDKRY